METKKIFNRSPFFLALKKLRPVGLLIRCLLFLVFLTACVLAQEHNTTGDWFLKDRILPYDSIPPDAFKTAVDKQWAMRQSEGYSAAPELAVWSNIGPTNDYKNGRVVRVKYDPTNQNVVYICGHNGGVWRSDNAQAQPSSSVVFNFKTEDLQTQSSGDIAIDPQSPSTVYYGTGGNVYCFSYNYYGIGVYKSTNRGDDWTGPFTTGLPALIFTSTIVVNPANHDVYLANGCGMGGYCTGYTGPGGGLYKSTNGGQSWLKVVPPSGYDPVYDVVISNNGQNIYAVTRTSYWRSTNAGSSFFEYPEGITNLFQNGRTQIAVSKANNNYVYLVTDNTSDGYNYAYVSTNAGYSFSIPPFRLGSQVDCMTHDFFFVQASPIQNHEEEAYVGWGGGGYGTLKRTTNGGVTWESVNTGGIDQNNFAFNPVNPDQGISCNDQGLYISNNILACSTCVSWGSLNYSLSVRENYRVATNPFNANDMVIAVTDAGFYKYSGGVLWTETHSGCDGTSVIHTRVATPDVFIAAKGVDGACSGINGTFASTDGGTGWQYHPNLSWSFWDSNLDWIGAFDENFDSPGTFYHPRRRHNGQNPPGPTEIIDINKSTNNGATWIPYQQNPITPITTGDASYSPQSISLSDDNPQIMYVSTKRWLGSNPLSQVWRTTNGGSNTWQNLHIEQNGIPNRVVTSIVADPCHENVVYLTLSGFGTGHVFKSTNYGANWKDISNPPTPGTGSFPPDLPVNYLIVNPLTSTQNRLFIGTDAGVYTTLDPDRYHVYGYYWTEVAEGLPNTVCLGLDFNKLSNKLRAALFGRGVWEVTLQEPIYLTCGQILSSTEQGLDVANDIVVDSGATLTIPGGATIRMPANKKIVLQEGSNIDVTSSDPVYFTSQSGSWGGIEIHDGAYGTIKNCVFSNTETPITIESQSDGGPNILITKCTFNDGSITISGRDNVTISQCTTNTASASTGTAINAIYCDNLVLSQNTINDCWGAGIMVSNSSPVILNNVINHSEETNSAAGISLDNCYSGTVNGNEINNFNSGIYLYYSSPTMLENTAINSTTSMGSAPSAVHANYLSSPRLKPTDDGGGGIIWDAGLNELKTNNQGSGIYLNDMSIPNIDYGYNTIHGYDYHLSGYIGSGEQYDYYARDNCWTPNYPPLRENISDATVNEDPYNCNPPGGGGLPSLDIREPGDNPSDVAQQAIAPPPPIIINYGNGIYDTIRVSSGQLPMTADQLLFSQGVDAEIAGNYALAVSKYQQVVQNYQDSNTAISSMKKILYCKDRMHVNINEYTALRAYYQSLVQQNSADTAFVKAGKEMASKCLVRIGQFPDAIIEYEGVAQNSNDSLEVLCAELNIIETYMIMEQGGDMPGFTGQLKQLKPPSLIDAIKMINEKLHRYQPNKTKPLVPEVFSLSQNYPNPFNPLTKINYAIPKKSNVTMKVYDILGRLVKSLVNEPKEPGYYTVQFDGSSYASGVYFYKIEAGDFVQSKKMVLIK